MRNADLMFCPRCADRLEWRGVEYPDVLHPVCTKCGFILWQNPKPTVDALIVRERDTSREVLLGRRIAEPRIRWDTPGGFLNAGDRIEDTLIRECRREMSVEIAVRELVGVFEDMFYDIPIIALFYDCELISGEPSPHDYIDEVAWFPIDEPPALAFQAVREGMAALRSKLGS